MTVEISIFSKLQQNFLKILFSDHHFIPKKAGMKLLKGTSGINWSVRSQSQSVPSGIGPTGFGPGQKQWMEFENWGRTGLKVLKNGVIKVDYFHHWG